MQYLPFDTGLWALVHLSQASERTCTFTVWRSRVWGKRMSRERERKNESRCGKPGCPDGDMRKPDLQNPRGYHIGKPSANEAKQSANILYH